MTKELPPSRTAEQFVVRFPDGMRDRIAEEAKKSNRSMNAEIVARLDDSFQAATRTEEQAFQEGFESASLRIEVERLREQLHAERMQKSEDRASADATGKMLEKLPADLASQYGLHLYREQLDRIHQQAEAARQQYQPLYDDLQRLLSIDGPPGPRTRAKKAVSDLQKRIHELEEQARVTEQTISGIHTYRKVYDLPELRNIQSVVAVVKVEGPHAMKIGTPSVVQGPPPEPEPKPTAGSPRRRITSFHKEPKE